MKLVRLARLILSLAAGGCYGLGLSAAAKLAGEPVDAVLCGVLAGGVLWLVTEVYERLLESRRRPLDLGYLVGAGGVMIAAALLFKLPAGPIRAVVAQFSPQSFASSEAVPLGAVALLRAELAFGLVIVSAVLLGLARVLLSRRTAPSSGWLWLGLLAVYAPLAWSGAQLQSLTGDEPHYLLMTRSLARDLDLDLGNDYAGLYREFYPSDRLRRALGPSAWHELDPHEVPGRRGEPRPVHLPGLSLLLLPGYLLCGWRGAVATIVLLMTTAAWWIVRLAVDLAPSRGWGRFGGLAVVLLSPVLAYAGSLHAETAALLCVSYLGCLVAGPADRPRSNLAVFLALFALPWLHVKYLPLALLLGVWLCADARSWRPALGFIVGVLTQSLAFWRMYGSPWPNAPQLNAAGRFPSAFSGLPWVGLPGLLFDQQDGLCLLWPVVLLAIPGFALVRQQPRLKRLMWLLAVQLGLIASYQLWRSGYAPGGRQLLPVLGLLGPFVAAGAAAVAARRPWLVRLLVAVNGLTVLLGAWVPRLRYPVEPGGVPHNPVLARLPLPWLDALLPAVGSGGTAWFCAVVYTVAAMLWLWRSGRCDQEDSAVEG